MKVITKLANIIIFSLLITGISSTCRADDSTRDSIYVNEIRGIIYSTDTTNLQKGVIIGCVETSTFDTTSLDGKYSLYLDTFSVVHIKCIYSNRDTIEFGIRKASIYTYRRVDIDFGETQSESTPDSNATDTTECLIVLSYYGSYRSSVYPTEFDEYVRVLKLKAGDEFGIKADESSPNIFELLEVHKDSTLIRFGANWDLIKDGKGVTTNKAIINYKGTELATRRLDANTHVAMWLQH